MRKSPQPSVGPQRKPGGRAASMVAALLAAGFAEAAAQPRPDSVPAGNDVVVEVRTLKDPGPTAVLASASGTVEAAPEIVWKLIDDCGNYQVTMDKIKTARELSREEGKVVCTVVADMPFFFADLVSVTEAVHVTGPPVWSRSWTLLRGDFSVNSGYWRVSAIAGDPGRSLLEYRITIAPKLGLPGWLVSRIQKRVMRKTLPDLYRKIERLAPALYGTSADRAGAAGPG